MSSARLAVQQWREERAATYREAARLIEEKRCVSWFSCHAIVQAMSDGVWTLGDEEDFIPENYPLVTAYGEWMRPDFCEGPAHWFGHEVSMDEQRDQRVLMLCLMAAMVETGDA